MDQYTIKELIEKYLAGECTDEEREWIETWYLEQEDKEAADLSPEKLEIAVNRVWERLAPPIIPSRILPLWYGVAAAAILIFLTVGTYVVLHNLQGQQLATTPGIQHIVPGSNKAVLTLADGRQIGLNGTKNGKLAIDGSAIITKTDSVIAYNTGAKPDNLGAATLYNKMTTPRGGQFQLILPDGTHAWLNAASSITYPIAFNGHDRKVVVTGKLILK